MPRFETVNDETLVARISSVQKHLAYVAPAVSLPVARALADVFEREDASVTVILDADEDAYRIGFGDPEGLAFLHEYVRQNHHELRREPGLRIGILVADDSVTIWSPAARSVEGERLAGQANGLVLESGSGQGFREVLGAEGSDVLPSDAQLGKEPLPIEETERMVEALKKNPPVPFDLSQKMRVFSTKFQFVETELRGAEWTQRRIRLSNLLLNADLPEDLLDILDTQIRPYQGAADLELEVPALVMGQIAHSKTGEPILAPMRQSQIEAAWADIQKRYLWHVKSFGWIVERTKLQAFQSEVAAFETVLREWVKKFREQAEKDESKLVKNIVAAVKKRLDQSDRQKSGPVNLEQEILKGLQRMRIAEPRVRVVLKNISWESTRDTEFIRALREAVPAKLLEGWFEEFDAVRQRPLDQ